MPDHNILCLTVSSVHPALQKLRLLPASLCIYPLSTCCHECGQSFHTLFVYYILVFERPGNRCTSQGLFTTKVPCSKNSSINSKQAVSLSRNVRSTSHHSYCRHLHLFPCYILCQALTRCNFQIPAAMIAIFLRVHDIIIQ